MLGFILVALKVIVLLLINGTNATDIILSPTFLVTVFGTNTCLIPVLVFVPVLVVVWISRCITLQPWPPLCLYCSVLLLVDTPVQWFCHSFQTVPNSTDCRFGLPEFLTKVSHVPSSFVITKSGALSVSFHSSVCGVKAIEPIQVNIPNGFTLTVLLA